MHAVRRDTRGGRVNSATTDPRPRNVLDSGTGRETQPIAHVPDWGWLEAGLAVAARSDGMTFVALPAPVVAASAILDEFRDAPLVSWAAGDLTLVGVGIARELRGTGARRWAEVIAGAHSIASGVPDATDEPRDTMPTALDDASRAVIAGVVSSTSALGFARPRFVGGAAFTPGAADQAPWQGFGDAWFALPRWTYVHDGNRAFLVLAVDATAARDHGRWRDELAIHRAAFATAFVARPQPPLAELHPADAARWHTQVTEITDAIAHGTCSKIVAARTCSVALAGRVRIAELLSALDDRHADCVRVMIKPPGAGALVAATPERLVQRDGNVVRCDALAGSISSEGDLEEATQALLASAKDRREHAIVVDAVRAVLEGAGGIVDAPAEPTVRALRHVLHLYTPFRAELRAPRHVLDLAARLHPTPAVGGTPSDVAAAWIEAHEPAARGWYAAPVGWFDLDGNGELAVALRSGVIDGDRAHLWAGAGIVAGSDPDRELAETEIKLRAMLGALGVTA
jgi:menaquinone-specific isochorismate synthase